MVTAEDSLAQQYYNEGLGFAKLGQYSEALTSYNKSIAINPNYVEAWNNRGVALHQLGRYTEAIVSYDTVLVIDPNNTEAKQNRNISIEKKSQAQPAPLLYAPIGAIILIVGIVGLNWHHDPNLK